MLEAASTGSYLTGETSAALEFLAEQLPPMADLCRLIEEKLRLERELAERERLAMLGQMAASVSHNLRNPLSSMKTVLQVQLEKPDLPADLRHDCALVVGEIDRMSAKLKQLLNFAKPSVNGQRVAAVALAKQTAALFRHDAERRNVILEFDGPEEEVSILASEEALSEVFSNLIVNAIEAQPDGGRVRVGLARSGDHLEIQWKIAAREFRRNCDRGFFSRSSRPRRRAPGWGLRSWRAAWMKWAARCRARVRSTEERERDFVFCYR